MENQLIQMLEGGATQPAFAGSHQKLITVHRWDLCNRLCDLCLGIHNKLILCYMATWQHMGLSKNGGTPSDHPF